MKIVSSQPKLPFPPRRLALHLYQDLRFALTSWTELGIMVVESRAFGHDSRAALKFSNLTVI